jgi:hypothetical protein
MTLRARNSRSSARTRLSGAAARLVVGLAAAALWAAAPAGAATFSLTKIVDTATPMPGAGEDFGQLGVPALEHGTLAFSGQTASEDFSGIYRTTGGPLAVVADGTAAFPGGPGTLTGFSPPSLSEGQIAFSAASTLPDGGGRDQRGVFLATPGGLAAVADSSMVAPDNDGRLFGGFSRPSLHAGEVAFTAEVEVTSSSFYYAVFTTGSLAEVAGPGTAVPGGGSFLGSFFGSATRDGADVVFFGEGPISEYGLYRSGPGGIAAIARNGDPMPDSGGKTFGPLTGQATARGGMAAFGAVDSTFAHFGMYLAGPGGIARVADSTTAIPGESGQFLSFGPASLDDGAVAFIGYRFAGDEGGLFTTLGGGLSRVLGAGDSLDGKTVFAIDLGPEGLSCTSVAFVVRFTDDTQAIYRADLDGVTPCAPDGGSVEARAARLWLVLADPANPLVRADVRVEMLVNGQVVGAALKRCLGDLARAREISIPLRHLDPVALGPGDQVGLRVLARIGTQTNGSRCRPLLSPRATEGLRLLYSAEAHRSRLRAELIPGTTTSLFLHSDGRRCSSGPDPAAAAFELREQPPTAAQPRCRDSGTLDFAGANPWVELGTWTR